MRTERLFYRVVYRYGRPQWDTGRPWPELEELIADHAPGRALDLGCGTGTNSVYLASHGWDVVGVDFAPEAITAAEAKASAAGLSARFVRGDVTKLRALGIAGPFDFVVDIGCYHSVPSALRDAYATEVAAVTRSGARFWLVGVADPPLSWRSIGARGTSAAELRQRFGAAFTLVGEQRDDPSPRGPTFAMYRMVRE